METLLSDTLALLQKQVAQSPEAKRRRTVTDKKSQFLDRANNDLERLGNMLAASDAKIRFSAGSETLKLSLDFIDVTISLKDIPLEEAKDEEETGQNDCSLKILDEPEPGLLPDQNLLNFVPDFSALTNGNLSNFSPQIETNQNSDPAPVRRGGRKPRYAFSTTVIDGITHYGCDLCGAKFKNKKILNNHRSKVHIRGKHLKCDYWPTCKKMFYDNHAKNIHLEAHKRRLEREQKEARSREYLENDENRSGPSLLSAGFLAALSPEPDVKGEILGLSDE